MLITCPYCGPRDVSEFTYQGDANRKYPGLASTDEAAWSVEARSGRVRAPSPW